MLNQKHILNNISPIEVFDIISSQTVPDDVKLAHIQNLKTHIKKDTIDLRNVDIYLQIICKGLEIINSNISSVSFNSLFYLIKRINVQDSSGAILERQSFLILPILINKLGSSSSGSGSGVTLAKKSLEDYWLSNADAVEEAILEISFTGSNIRITIESINWITQVFKNISSKLNVSKFVPKILKSLKQNSHNQELVSSIQDLFSVYLMKNPSVTDELQRLIQQHLFPSIVVERLLKKLPLKEPELRSLETDVTMDTEVTSYPHGTLETTLTAASTGHEAELHELLSKVNYRLDSSVKPIDIQDSHGLYSTFEVFAPSFEGKETESNWKIREKNVVQMRSILRGNSALDFHSELIQCLQNLSVGICKATSSLRTTLSSNSCQFLKECAIILRYSFETISENIFPTLIKLCASTKNIASTNANMAVCALYANLPYSQRMVQRIVTASEERNHQPRSYSLIWLHIVLLRIGIDHSYIGSHELFFLEAANKVFMKLLKDANPNVRQVAKECYWCFTRIYPNDAEKLLKKLEPNIVRALERSQRESGGSGIGPIKSFTSRPSRPSIKEAIMEKNKELRQKRPPSRNSTESIASRNPLPLPKPPRSKTPTSRLEKSLVRPADKPQQQQSQHHQQPLALRAASWTQPTQSSLIAAATVRPKQRERSKTEVLKKSPIVVADIKPTKTNGHHSSRPASDIDMPIFDRANDPMLNFLSSENSSLIAEGINLLKYAIISGEDIPDEVNGMLKKISERHVLLMKPLFNANDKVFKKAGKLLHADDFLRVCMLIFPGLDDNTFDLIIATIELDVFYRASCSLLTCISDLPNIPGSHALVMQILNHKLEITKVVLQGLLISLSKLPIADIQFENIFQELTRLIILLKGTDNFQLLSQLFRQLYTIDSNKFVLLLEDVEIKLREEIAIIVGIEKSRVKVPSVAFSKNIDEMTEVRRPNGGFISPAKRPTTANDFTMVLAKRSELLHGINEPVRPKLLDINDALSRPNLKTIKGVSPLRPATDQSDMLVDEFSNVSITEDASKLSPMKNRDNRAPVNGAGVNNDNLKHIMDKIDPFKSMSSKMRKISIFEDNKRQERNWSNLQYARLPRGNQPTTTTTPAAAATGATSHHHRQHLLNQFLLNKEDFERNCKNLSDMPNQSNVLKVTAIMDNLNASDYEFREYFMNKGKIKLESSLWNFFDKIDITRQQLLLLNGLYLLKQLIKFNDSLSSFKLFQLLKRTCKDEELDSEMFFIWNELLFSIPHILISSDLEESILKYLESNEKNLTVSSLSLNYLAKILLEDKFLDLVKLYRLDKILGGLFNEDEVMFRKSAVVCFSNLFKNEWMSLETRDTLNKLKSKYPVSQQRLIEFYVKR
ncbi:Protein STU1 [Candida viswanathii]|uniref:Protein STU1 n=1 Tax=Candida viswanathii TaxID=5486 RepID=A0A367XSP6_9ASCO|nr:Protein STU1 [Candida viswanathii]